MRKTILQMCVSIIWVSACATTSDTNSKHELNAETQEIVEVEKSNGTDQAMDVADPDDVALSSPYETLVYGETKELVCKPPILAEGKLKTRPNIQVMWENYLYDRPEGIWGEVGGMVEVNGNLPFDQGQWTNACTVRLSHMLNKAGHKIPRDVNNKTVSGGNKDQYYYRLADMESYLIQAYGQPDLNISDGTANSFDLPITPGIVLMDFPNNSFTGHITVWNGAGTVDGAEIGGYRVLFWDLPCFIPQDRTSAPPTDTSSPKT